ncbi:MAG: GGDEF domain-containing protein [Alcanivoracaceae bacterium]|nr:GGDEF domain-containing protein [Alcanivoracaceae bacterium]
MALRSTQPSQPLPSGTDLPIPWNLRLPKPLEGDFISYLLRFSRRIILGSIVVVIFIYAGGLLTEQLISDHLLQQIWRLRLFTLIPVGAVWWLAKEDKHPRALQPAIAACCIIIAGIHDYVALYVDHPLAYTYYLVNLFAILLMATLFRISLYWAATVSAIILAMLAISLLLDERLSTSLAYTLFYFISATAILSLLGQYFFERLQRQFFLAERVLAMHRSELHSANQVLESQASEDALTGTVNRRGMEIRLGSLIHHARHNQQLDKLFILLFDIDFFKQFNDTYGHLEGDLCLKQIANVPKAMIQNDSDFVARYGGEEFLIALSGIQLNDALIFAERLRSRIEQLGVEHSGSRVNNVVTISVGISGLIPGITRADEMIKRADEALYEAKGIGRNTVVLIDAQEKLIPQ